jgi:hypothetical protein
VPLKYFLDCEFYEDGKTIDLISIGIVAEDGREYYAVNADFDWNRVWIPGHFEKAAWVRDNVLPQVDRSTGIPHATIRDQVRDFVLFQPAVEFWGFYSASDWVCLYQLWGRLIDLPSYFPKWCRDIKQLQHDLVDPYGNLPQLPYDPKIHHALEDARWQKRAYESLVEHAEYVRKQNPVIELNKFFQ